MEALPTADELVVSVEELIKKEELETTTQYIKYVCKELKEKMMNGKNRDNWYVKCAKTVEDCELYHEQWRFGNHGAYGSVITPYEVNRYSDDDIDPERYSESLFINQLMDAGYNVHVEIIKPTRDFCDIDTWCMTTPLEVYVIRPTYS